MAEMKYDHPLLVLTEKQVLQFREQSGLDVKRLKEAIQTVYDWCAKEEHLQAALPALAKTNYVERALLLSKGSIEECKKRVDGLLTARGLMSELCLNRNIEEFKPFQKCVSYCTMPKLSSVDLSRVVVTQFKENMDEFTMLKYLRYAYLLGEYRLYDDYGIAETYILDMKHFHFGVLAKLNPILLKKSEVVTVEGYGTKIKGIHIINAPSFVDKFVFIIKQSMKPKVAGRIQIHNSYEDLHKFVPKEILPTEFGGDEKSLEELTELWNDLMSTEEARERIKNLDLMVSDESKRCSTKFNEDYLGMPGSFRKLDVD